MIEQVVMLSFTHKSRSIAVPQPLDVVVPMSRVSLYALLEIKNKFVNWFIFGHSLARSVRYGWLVSHLVKKWCPGIVKIVSPVEFTIGKEAMPRLQNHLLLLKPLRTSEQLGIRAVEVDAIDEAARQFYLKFGFTPLEDDPHHLFLPMQVIHKLGLPPLTHD